MRASAQILNIARRAAADDLGAMRELALRLGHDWRGVEPSIDRALTLLADAVDAAQEAITRDAAPLQVAA